MNNFKIIKNPEEVGEHLFKCQRMNKFCDAELVVGEQRWEKMW